MNRGTPKDLRWIGLAALLFVGLHPFTCWAAEDKTSAPSANQIQTWIKDLSAEDFQKRKDAKAHLLKAGTPAIAALKEVQNTPDVEVRSAAIAILNKLKWSTLRADIDYLELFPKESAVAGSLSNINGLVEKLKKTSLGQLIQGPHFKPLLDLLFVEIEKNPKAWEKTKTWLARLNGPVAGAMWALDPTDPSKNRMAAILRLPEDKAAAIFEEFLSETGIAAQSKAHSEQGLDMLLAPDDSVAIALVGNHVILGANVASVLKVADGLVAQPADSLLKSPILTSLKSHFPKSIELAFIMDMQGYLKMLTPIMGVMGGAGPDLFNKMGYDTLEAIAMTTTATEAGFEDRLYVACNDKPTKTNALIDMAWKSTTPLKDVFSVVPADAVMVGNYYIEGQPLLDWGIDYFKAIIQMQAPMLAMMGQPVPDPDEIIKKAEADTGIKLSDFSTAIKGDAVFWVRLSQGLVPPEIGISIGCADAKGPELAENLFKIVNAIVKTATGLDAPAMEIEKKGGHTIYTESPGSPLMVSPARKMIPYRLTWAAIGNRVIISSSVPVLQDRLMAIAAKDAGFDPERLLGARGTAEVIPKTIQVLDLPKLLNYGNQFGLPLLAATAASKPELQKALNDLAAKPDLYSALKPVTSEGYPPTKDRIQVTVIKTPAGIMPAYAAVLGGFVGFFVPRQAMMIPPAGGVGGGGGDGGF